MSDRTHGSWTQKGTGLIAAIMDRYKPALLLLTIAIVPLFYISMWIGLTALLAAYALTAKLANNDFDRQSRRRTKASHHQPRR